MIDQIKSQNELIAHGGQSLPPSAFCTLSLPHLLPCCCHSDRWVQTQNNFAAEKKKRRKKNPFVLPLDDTCAKFTFCVLNMPLYGAGCCINVYIRPNMSR